MQDSIWLKSALSSMFKMTDLGKVKVLLGLETIQNRPQREPTTHQGRHTNRTLSRNGISEARPNLTPLDPNTQVISGTSTVAEATDNKLVIVEVSKLAVGSPMYAMLRTRPDITYTIVLVSQFNHAPQWDHWIAVKYIFHYLVTSIELGLRYGMSNLSGEYTDADWEAGEDRKSVGGFVFLINGRAISWTSKK